MNNKCIALKFCISYKQLTKKLYQKHNLVYKTLLFVILAENLHKGYLLIKVNKPLYNKTKIYFKPMTKKEDVTFMTNKLTEMHKEILAIKKNI